MSEPSGPSWKGAEPDAETLARAEELVKELDTEVRFRDLIGTWARIVTVLGVILSLFHVYTAGFGVLIELKHRAIHLAFVMGLIFLTFPMTKRGMTQRTVPWYDAILAVLAASWSIYILWNFDTLIHRSGEATPLDLAFGGLAIVMVLEATRRTMGWSLPLLGLLFLVYAYFGPYFPGFLAHRGQSVSRIIEHMYLSTEGIYGIPVGVVATYVFHFVLFGVFASRTGLGQLFIDLATAVAGRLVGGPAKVSIISSGLFGMISGSSIANTVTTGAFTIPMMKKIGYRAQFAGAVEATASTGGQITPPIMGAAAFVMAEFLGTPYTQIALAAVFPALLHYIGVYVQVHLEAKRYGLRGLTREELPDLKAVMRDRGYNLIPLLLLVYLLVRSRYPARFGGRGASQRFTLLAAFGAAATFALLLFGSNVTAAGPAMSLVFPDWPLMNGTLVPVLSELTVRHVLHRWVAIVVGLIVVAIGVVAWRTQRDRPVVSALAVSAAILFPIQALVGGLQVMTKLAEWTQTLHLALGAIVWGLMVALAVTSYYEARTTARPGPAGGPGERDEPAGRRTLRDSVTAYVALTKPRIIELLLVTTVPAMVLATREVPGIQLTAWGALVAWTLVAGTLAAGSANAINCYIDRDIDQLMTRTRRRPLPAQQVEPERAMVFGIALGIISIVVMAWFVNLIAAFLTLLAIAFYVVIYTMLLKRTSTQNIVIGGAAGALPPVIGWAAVTGNVGIPALLLFALVFYWTPPHFWALSLRIRKDYAAAGVPMLPVVRGIAETSRQIVLYSVLMVAVSLALWAVARMGPVYLVAAVVLGALFLRQAWILWRQGSAPDASTAQAIRLYKYSISYLTLLFAAVALDAMIAGPIA